jgi:guanyl-specific ribonuclease Sa
MKKIIPVIIFAALALCGCKSENGENTESTTAVTTTVVSTTVSTTSSVTTTAASTATTTTTTATSTETTTAISSEEMALIEEGIIPPEADEVYTEEEIPQETLPVSEDDKPIELPIIPIR